MTIQLIAFTSALPIFQFIALFLLLLVAGIFWGLWVSISRSYEVFSIAELNHIAKTIAKNLALPMRLISISCVVCMGLSAWFYPEKESKGFFFNIASIVFILTALVITILIELPIANQIIAWTPSTAPANWGDIRNRWKFHNIIRTLMALLSFGFFAASIFKTFK
jgi:uncharacterized membrane protein